MEVLRRIGIILLVSFIPMITQAQCAMCRTQVVNNVSHGETTFAAGLNTGILYLFVAPYILIGTLAYFWFKYSKVRERKESIVSRLKRQVP